MPTTPPIYDWDHEKGCEIPTKHKEAIRELAGFGGKSVEQLAKRYELGESTIRRVLNYEAPERARPTRTGRKQLLTDKRLNKVIKYCSEKWANRILKYDTLVNELDLKYTSKTLMYRLH
jgi:transposase